MSDKVVDMGVWTTHRVAPDTVLEGNVGKFEKVLVLGVTPEGRFVACTSESDMCVVEHLAQKFIHKCHDGSY